MAGIELTGAPEFLVGSTVNAGAKGKSPELVIEKMNKEIEAGAQFFISPPLFDLSAIEPFTKRVDIKKAKIIPTVLLLKSLGMARYIMRNVEDVYVPDSLVDRIQKSPDKVRECTLIASETVSLLKNEGYSGVHIATLGWEHKLPEILERI
jgi:5,10-methylenetetrahydrofolate reductase